MEIAPDRNTLRTILAQLETEHHGVCVSRWAELLEVAYSDYTEPAQPPSGHLVLSKQSRVEIYRQRLEAGYHWQHPADLKAEEVDSLGVEVSRLRNGEICEGGIIESFAS